MCKVQNIKADYELGVTYKSDAMTHVGTFQAHQIVLVPRGEEFGSAVQQELQNAAQMSIGVSLSLQALFLHVMGRKGLFIKYIVTYILSANLQSM